MTFQGNLNKYSNPSKVFLSIVYVYFELFTFINFQDLYVFVSEQERFKDFKNPASLFWLEEELVYGDWTSGPNSDGSFMKSGQLPISEVKSYV